MLVLGKATLMLILSEGFGVHKWEFVQSRQVFGSQAPPCWRKQSSDLVGRSLTARAAGVWFCSSIRAAWVQGNPHRETSGMKEAPYLNDFPEP